MQRSTLIDYLFKDIGFIFSSGSKSKGKPVRKTVNATLAKPATPAKSEFTVSGELQAPQRMLFAVDGQEFIITSDTWVVGSLEPGARVKVKGVVEVGNEKYATSIVVTPPENRSEPKPRK